MVSNGIEKGHSIDQMVYDIEREEYLDGRIERILRTEINRAINYGNDLAAKSVEFKTKKEWVAVDDHRTRPAHHEADGQRVEIDEKFRVDGELLDFPGDPTASAANTINCRCVTSIIADRDRTGRLQPVRETVPVERVTGAGREAVLVAIRALS